MGRKRCGLLGLALCALALGLPWQEGALRQSAAARLEVATPQAGVQAGQLLEGGEMFAGLGASGMLGERAAEGPSRPEGVLQRPRMDVGAGQLWIAGVVLDPRGRQLRDARLVVRSDAGTRVERAGADGRFRLCIEGSSTCEVTASDPLQRYGETCARDVPPGATDLVLRLAPAPEITLLVRGGGEGIVERFAVATITRQREVREFFPEDEHPEGRFALRVPAGFFWLEVRASGWLPKRLGPFDASLSASDTPRPPVELEVRLHPAVAGS